VTYTEVERKQKIMHAADEKPVTLFNTLVGINNNRIECYRFAGKETDTTTFRILFTRLVETSLICNEELVTEVYKLGGVPFSGTLGTGGFFQNWLKIHKALMDNNRRDLIAACAGAEEMVRKAYSDLLDQNNDVLNTFQMNILRGHLSLLAEDAQRVNNLQTLFVAAA
jgi:uncharacterized protein (TIGR02284 family)